MQYACLGSQLKNDDQALAKILCGIDPYTFTDSSINLTAKEVNEIEIMLSSAINQWRALKNTSIDSFREFFLTRIGALTITEGNYTLVVENTSFDILLEQIPWNIRIIKTRWMKKILTVEW